MKIAVIANGDKYAFRYPDYDRIICVDGAAEWAYNNGIKIDVCVGDMDSVKEDILENIPKVIRYNTEKDETDTLLALEYASSLSPDGIHLYGALGKRLDHELANISLLFRFPNLQIIDKCSRSYAATGKIIIGGGIGTLVSIFPFGRDVLIRSTKGLKYPVENRILSVTEPYFISNEIVGKQAEILVDGYVLVVLPEEN